MEKDEMPRKELVKPTLEKEQLCVIRSMLKQVKQFEGLSNFARMDIAQSVTAKEAKKGKILIDRTSDEGVHIYILVAGRIRIFTNDKKFEEFMVQFNSNEK
jgi:CRP-like cAMP-binding protein